MAATTNPAQTSGDVTIQQHLALIASSGILSGDVWAYTLGVCPWVNLLPRGQFQTGRGARQRTMHFERALAGTGGKFAWAEHTSLGNSSAATGNSPPDIAAGSRSLPPVTSIQSTYKVDEYGLKWAACESPRFDVRDAIFNYNFVEQFSMYYEKVKEGAAHAWEYEMRDAYFRMCKYKYLIGAPATATPTNPYFDLSVVAPQSVSELLAYTDAQIGVDTAAIANGSSTNHSVLTNGILQDLRPKIERSGALKGGKSGGLIPLVCSPEQKYYLLHEPGLRTDLRYGNAGVLLKGMGDNYTDSFLGYNMIPDPEVPRFTLVDNGSNDNDFVESLAWSYQAGNLSTTTTAAATYNSGLSTKITTAASGTVGLVANNVVRISNTTASAGAYNGEWTVLAVLSTTEFIINKAWDGVDISTGGTVYMSSNGESGWVPNPTYETAPYEMSFIVFPQVCEIQTLDYPSTLGNGSEFDSQPRPLGSFKWKNIENEDTNPDGTLGYYRGIFEYAVKPMKTEHGYALLHRRAPAITLASPSFAVVSGLGQFS